MQNRYWTKTKNITIIQEKCERKGKNRQKQEQTNALPSNYKVLHSKADGLKRQPLKIIENILHAFFW